MKKFLLVLAIGVHSCDAQITTSIKEHNEIINENKPDFNVALKFINDYVKYTLSEDKNKPSSTTWVKLNTLLTPTFKAKYKSLIESADPELGLDVDPILAAQDLPDKGFVISKTDASHGYVTVSGVGWKEFKVNLKVIQLNNKWLVDGAGVVNIPKNKQAKW